VHALAYNWRNTSIIKKLRELTRSKEYGKLRRLEVARTDPWNYTNESSFYTKLGYLTEHAVHDINYLRYINGEIEEVNAIAYGRLPDNPTSITVEFRYASGAEGIFNMMNGSRKSSFNIQCAFDEGIIIGTESHANPDYEWSDVPYFRLFCNGGEIFSDPTSVFFPTRKQHKIPWQKVVPQGVIYGLSHQRIIEDFTQAIELRCSPASDLFDGYMDLRVIEAVKRSINTRSSQKV
jgi:predicted dehydrogenase